MRIAETPTLNMTLPATRNRYARVEPVSPIRPVPRHHPSAEYFADGRATPVRARPLPPRGWLVDVLV
jgi:hypothetical protein